MSLFGAVGCKFHLVGELVGKRPIDKGDFHLRLWKVAARGSTYEVQVDAEQYERGIIDAAYEVVGDIAVEGQRTKLVATKIDPYTPRVAQSASVARGAV